MNQSGSSPEPRILLVPLDWGLGHATRCIPLIHALQRQRCSVLLAGEGPVKDLLQQEFPTLPFLPMKGYHVRYTRSRRALPFALATQIPKILSAIKYENERLKTIVKEQHIDAVISDNRYGLYYPGLPTIFLTHQLLIKTPWGKRIDHYLQKLNYSYINQFAECWVPDNEHNGHSLAGELAHPLIEPAVPVRYLGPLSRFAYGPSQSQHLLFLLSGPEPQRTLLENIFLKELKQYNGKAVLVRGLPGKAAALSAPANTTVYNHLPADALREKMLGASLVFARCGYSTVMDLAALQKKSVLLPTPGQTEQEYLGQHLSQNHFALCVPQHKFKLAAALDLAAAFPYQLSGFTGEPHLDRAIKSLLYKIEFGAFRR